MINNCDYHLVNQNRAALTLALLYNLKIDLLAIRLNKAISNMHLLLIIVLCLLVFFTASNVCCSCTFFILALRACTTLWNAFCDAFAKWLLLVHFVVSSDGLLFSLACYTALATLVLVRCKRAVLLLLMNSGAARFGRHCWLTQKHLMKSRWRRIRIKRCSLTTI